MPIMGKKLIKKQRRPISPRKNQLQKLNNAIRNV